MKTTLTSICGLMVYASVVLPTMGQVNREEDAGAKSLQRHLEQIIPRANDLVMVVFPSRLASSSVWPMLDSDPRQKILSLLPTEPQNIAAIALSSTTDTFHKWNNQFCAATLNQVPAVRGATMLPDGTGLESVTGSGDKNMVMLVQFVEKQDLGSIQQWIKTAPPWLFNTSDPQLEFETKQWNGHNLLINEHSNSLCVLQLDERSYAVLRPNMLKHVKPSDAEPVREHSAWISRLELESGSADFAVACRLERFREMMADRDFGSFEVVKSAETAMFWLDLSGSSLVKLDLVFDVEKNAKLFKRKLSGAHQLFAGVVAANVAKMGKQEMGDDEQWISRRVLEIYNSVQFVNQSTSVAITVPRPDEMVELVKRVADVQLMVSKREKTRFKQNPSIISDP